MSVGPCTSRECRVQLLVSMRLSIVRVNGIHSPAFSQCCCSNGDGSPSSDEPRIDRRRRGGRHQLNYRASEVECSALMPKLEVASSQEIIWAREGNALVLMSVFAAPLQSPLLF